MFGCECGFTICHLAWVSRRVLTQAAAWRRWADTSQPGRQEEQAPAVPPEPPPRPLRRPRVFTRALRSSAPRFLALGRHPPRAGKCRLAASPRVSGTVGASRPGHVGGTVPGLILVKTPNTKAYRQWPEVRSRVAAVCCPCVRLTLRPSPRGSACFPRAPSAPDGREGLAAGLWGPPAWGTGAEQRRKPPLRGCPSRCVRPLARVWTRTAQPHILLWAPSSEPSRCTTVAHRDHPCRAPSCLTSPAAVPHGNAPGVSLRPAGGLTCRAGPWLCEDGRSSEFDGNARCPEGSSPTCVPLCSLPRAVWPQTLSDVSFLHQG